MRSVIIKVKPNSRFHFGKPSLDVNTALSDTDEFIHSDVLFSALVNNIAQVKDNSFVERFIEQFENGNIKISSAFYCMEYQDNFLYLLPRPVNAMNFISGSYDMIKKTKDIKFISPKVLQQDPEKWKENVKIGGNILVTEEEMDQLGYKQERYNEIYNKRVSPNVVIHKPNENAEGPFSVRTIQIADLEPYQDIKPHVHFYFLYELESALIPEMKTAFLFAMKMIQLNGLGGERSSGCGFVEGIEEDENFSEGTICPDISDTLPQMSMGLLIPETEKDFNKFVFYNYTTRGGRMTASDKALKLIRMLTEGAIIKPGELCCVTADISPIGNRKYLRYGQALTIKIPNFYYHG